ncbi:hypothetical protein F5J12DRAFT_820836 [Pisolithus orientalis]|uniref:uncharacterized protein n=1 Tax=Pisolithus orientalis TaxID=936130 RepID=UPI0022245EA3|nr:uncharacterized protein F5J12DRAFT_820836 [Pisolithus orientalis]KAI6012800.1 hypothetical protein F5J12DRAFT_820836 [Pisolithus orientalis]
MYQLLDRGHVFSCTVLHGAQLLCLIFTLVFHHSTPVCFHFWTLTHPLLWLFILMCPLVTACVVTPYFHSFLPYVELLDCFFFF